MFYLQRTPFWLKKWLGSGIWEGKNKKNIYLTFDDGPHPTITPFVLDELRKFDAKATFFCIGKNVEANRNVYEQIINEGHSVGNHTYNHLNGWKTSDEEYLNDIAEAKKYIDSSLFRPPYGRITKFQLEQLPLARFQLQNVMWSLLSGDFDSKLSPEKCLQQILLKVRGGDIVVFHDSEKAFKRLQFVLPSFLQYCKEKGFQFGIIDQHL